jgi:hypothetical protein
MHVNIWTSKCGGNLHNEELHNLYSSPNFIKVIKSRRMRWAGECIMHGRDDELIQNFGKEILNKVTIRERRAKMGR